MSTTSPTQEFFDAKRPVKELTSDDESAVNRFKDFLRIPSITSDGPSGPNEATMQFLTKQCEDIGLEFEIHAFTPSFPVFVAKWEGSSPELPAILLNSHYDVVPVDVAHWHYPPFDATELPNGDIVARGAQDMKCVCIQHLEAVRRLKAAGHAPARTLYLAFQPDEEMGGILGMSRWVESAEFKKLNIGFALDEGIASETDVATVFYGERTVWWLRLNAHGSTGHASRFIENTAVEKLLKTVARFLEFRKEQEGMLKGHAGCKHASALVRFRSRTARWSSPLLLSLSLCIRIVFPRLGLSFPLRRSWATS
jgi:aminoacylase